MNMKKIGLWHIMTRVTKNAHCANPIYWVFSNVVTYMYIDMKIGWGRKILAALSVDIFQVSNEYYHLYWAHAFITHCLITKRKYELTIVS